MPTTKTTLIIGTKPFTIQRLTLRGWAELETLRRQIEEDVSNGDFERVFRSMIQFIETSSSQKIDWEKVPWYHFLEVFAKVSEINSPTIKFPMLVETKQEGKLPPWEYKGRSWFFWLNLFSSKYGWEEKIIENLDIDTAIGLYQEILIDEQLDKEWQWGLSEIAYPYNASSKKSEFKALDRPKWMLPMAPKSIPIVKIRKSLMPVGQAMTPPTKDGGKHGV